MMKPCAASSETESEVVFAAVACSVAILDSAIGTSSECVVGWMVGFESGTHADPFLNFNGRDGSSDGTCVDGACVTVDSEVNILGCAVPFEF